MKYKVLLDTDIGDDIDDAFALSLCLKSKETDLVAVTTVFRNTLCRAKQAKQLIVASGKAIPVYVGEGMPTDGIIPGFSFSEEGDLLKTLPCQYDDDMESFAVNYNATDAVIKYAEEYKGELIVITIGAMTNLYNALKKDPTIAGKIKKVVSMGGWFTNFEPEWNILCDPLSVQGVIDSGVQIDFVGLDVTLKCPLDDTLLDDFRKSSDPSNKLIVKWLDRWFKTFNFEKSVMHDPLAVASVIKNVCGFEKVYVKVVTEGPKRGAIEVKKEQTEGYKPVNVALSVDKDEFYKTIRDVLLA